MKVVITDHGFPSVETERRLLAEAGAELVEAQCRLAEEVLPVAWDAEVLLVQWAPIDAAVIAGLQHCRGIVRYGIGVDNVDLEAARTRGIPVCNVPDYGIEEVAEHALALGLALVRRLPQVDARMRRGEWKILPDGPVKSFSDLTLGTAGFGRIAQALHRKASALGCRRIAYDPYVSAEKMTSLGVEPVDREILLRNSDWLSLHLPLTQDTRHFISGETLPAIPSTAVIVNTARGALVDTVALANALREGRIGGAGLDVYEQEPLPDDHPIRSAPHTILTSHVAWYSEASIPRLQRKAAEEAVRLLLGKPPLHSLTT